MEPVELELVVGPSVDLGLFENRLSTLSLSPGPVLPIEHALRLLSTLAPGRPAQQAGSWPGL